jgi:hypothetical protein
MSLSRSKPMKPGTSQLTRSAFKPKPAATKKAAPAPKARMKSKQRAVTSAEKELWDQLAALGCVACLREGVFEPDVSIHHCDGRTKPGCHLQVLALCASHHQDGTGKNPHYIAVHPWKARFEQKFGTQESLIEICRNLLKV